MQKPKFKYKVDLKVTEDQVYLDFMETLETLGLSLDKYWAAAAGLKLEDLDLEE